MKRIRRLLCPFLCAGFLATGALAQTETTPAELSSALNQTAYRGLAFTTPYPATSVSLGEPTTLELTLQNYGLPPQRLDLSVEEAPEGWELAFLGGGVPVQAVHVTPDSSAELSLQIEPPARARAGDYSMTLVARSENETVELPLTLTLTQLLPAELTLTSDLPALRGTPTTPFTFSVSLQNDSGTDTTANLQAQSPTGFQVSFQSAGSEVTSIPVEAGGTQSLSVQVTPPPNVQAGEYQVLVQAISDAAQAELPLGLEVTGQPALSLSGVDGLLSARAAIGSETPLELVVSNDGSAPANNVTFSATAPEGWETSFAPEALPSIAPGQQERVRVNLTPSDNAIAGDYVVALQADSESLSQTVDFRITTTTSTLWGIVAVGVIAVALLIMGGSVARFGRR